MTDTPEQPEPDAPPPAPPPPSEPPPAAAQPALVRQHKLALPIMIGVGVLALLVAAFAVWQMQARPRGEDAYVVQPYTPPSEMIAARERAPGYAEPDTARPVTVEFGAGATLNVTGRVQRGIGNDWYAVDWNDQTVFVRTSDAVAGSGAPPAPEEREDEPEEDEVKLPEELKPDEEVIVDNFPDTPSAGGTLSIGDVIWIREPNSRDFARSFPQRALDSGQSGRVTLDCEIRGNGRLDCSVGNESPPGYGFGRAALNISRQLRVAPTLPGGASAAGRHLTLPLSFQAG
jgi:TonB family protein